MENYSQQPYYADYKVETSATHTGSRHFMSNVFMWMFGALGLSALCAFMFASNPEWMAYLITQSPTGSGLSTIGMIVMFAPIGFVLLMSFGYQRLSAPSLTFLFLLYAAVTGVSFSFILLAYTSSSVIGCFASAAVMFGVMAVMGYTTDKDLTSFGRLMYMGLIGIIVAMVINFFLHSSAMDYIVSFIGVMVFTGLTAYDVQKLKRIGAGIEFQGDGAVQAKKMSILGALSLYLDFINLFLMLLRLFGGRRN